MKKDETLQAETKRLPLKVEGIGIRPLLRGLGGEEGGLWKKGYSGEADGLGGFSMPMTLRLVALWRRRTHGEEDL